MGAVHGGSSRAQTALGQTAVAVAGQQGQHHGNQEPRALDFTAGPGAGGTIAQGVRGCDKRAIMCCPHALHTVPGQKSDWPGSRELGCLLKVADGYRQLRPETAGIHREQEQ